MIMKIILAAAVIFILYAAAENTVLLCVRHERLRENGIRIAHITDLHKRSFGKDNSRLIRKITAENPDIILVTGDLVSRDCRSFTNAGKFLRELCSCAPVYVIFGNHESDLPPELQNCIADTIKSAGAVLLNNSTETLCIRDRHLNLYGLALHTAVYKVNGGYSNLEKVTNDIIVSAIGEKTQGETILLVHNPLFAKEYADWGADYAVSGHVHGGAVRIPFTGIGLLSPERRFLPKYTKGVYQIGKMKLLLSGGLGKLRLFNPPEIVIYDI